MGTRSPSAYGQRWTCRITQHLVAHDVIIVSGLAAGIDRWVHQQTLDSGGNDHCCTGDWGGPNLSLVEPGTAGQGGRAGAVVERASQQYAPQTEPIFPGAIASLLG